MVSRVHLVEQEVKREQRAVVQSAKIMFRVPSLLDPIISSIISYFQFFFDNFCYKYNLKF